MEDKLNGRRTQQKTNSTEDDLKRRQPQLKTTSMEDDYNERQPQMAYQPNFVLSLAQLN